MHTMNMTVTTLLSSCHLGYSCLLELEVEVELEPEVGAKKTSMPMPGEILGLENAAPHRAQPSRRVPSFLGTQTPWGRYLPPLGTQGAGT